MELIHFGKFISYFYSNSQHVEISKVLFIIISFRTKYMRFFYFVHLKLCCYYCIGTINDACVIKEDIKLVSLYQKINQKKKYHSKKIKKKIGIITSVHCTFHSVCCKPSNQNLHPYVQYRLDRVIDVFFAVVVYDLHLELIKRVE